MTSVVTERGKMAKYIRQDAIDAYIMKCPYFAGKNTINRSNIGTHIGSCDLEHHYRKVCPSNECLCAERLGLKNE